MALAGPDGDGVSHPAAAAGPLTARIGPRGHLTLGNLAKAVAYTLVGLLVKPGRTWPLLGYLGQQNVKKSVNW